MLFLRDFALLAKARIFLLRKKTGKTRGKFLLARKKKKLTSGQPFYFPQGGFEPPQSEPESEVLPLHNRGISEYKYIGKQ